MSGGRSLLAMVLVASAGLWGCGSAEETAGLFAGATAGITALGAQSPADEIEQTYYLGVFDPQDQLPPQVYRIRVHGQSSFLNSTRFASGWVPASLLDSLGTSFEFDEDAGHVKTKKGDSDPGKTFDTGRRLMLFGPEGFREAPRNHRLVVVMGGSPEAFFQAVDRTLGVVAEAQAQQRNAAVDGDLADALLRLRAERMALDELDRDVRTDLETENGGGDR